MKSLRLLLLFLATATIATAQLDIPRPSPLGTVTQSVGLNTITIEYSRPGVKERTIFGELVPYGEVWRTGANARTTITLADDAVIAGEPVPAGTYGLFTIPGEELWTVILSTDHTSSAGAYTEENDLVRVQVKSMKTREMVETFTINVADIRNETATIELVWENTRVHIPFKTVVHATVMEQIAQATAGVDPMVYYRSAMYYYDNGEDLEQAGEWMQMALKQRQTFWMMHGYAKILAGLGDVDNAVAHAEKSIKMAEEAGSDHYVMLNKKLIAEIGER